ncbi:MAG: dihydropteroate synthase [Actinomycetota bacterium]|nr:dihydropteroate synthase [Actinomycetota bacterium]
MSPRHPSGLPEDLGKLERPLVIGVLNVTPDSFSDGGKHYELSSALAHGIHLFRGGADIIDVGGESTRPGATPVDAQVELSRVLPVVSALVAADVHVSIDTMKAEVAREAVAAGACLVNDVSGGLFDPAMYPTVAGLDVPYVLMHWRGHGAVMNQLAVYDDVAGEVMSEVNDRLQAAIAGGVDPDSIVIDPGLGFAKEVDDNWQVLHHLNDFVDLGYPVLIGASRKRFLGALLADGAGQSRAFAERDAATDAVSALAAAAGVWGVRVHNVKAAVDSVLVGRAWARGRQ